MTALLYTKGMQYSVVTTVANTIHGSTMMSQKVERVGNGNVEVCDSNTGRKSDTHIF